MYVRGHDITKPQARVIVLRLNTISVTAATGQRQRLVSDLTLRFGRPGCHAIIGASGSGKSTLLRTIAGVLQPSEGAVLWRGRKITRAGWRPGQCGYVPQFTIAHEFLTARENLADALALRERGLSPADRAARVRATLDAIGLADQKDSVVGVLSGGEKRRLSLGIELISSPDLLLCDEVTSGLDPRAEESVFDLLEMVSRVGNRQVIVVTHSLRHLDRYETVAVLDRGHCVYHGSPADLPGFFEVEHPDDVYAAVASRELVPWTPAVAADDETPAAATVDTPRAPVPNAVRQFGILLARRVRIFLRDRPHLALQVALAVGFPCLVVLFAHRGLPQIQNLSLTLDTGVVEQLQEQLSALSQAYSVGTLVSGIVMFQVILLALAGSNNGAREVVADRAILEKEKFSGVAPGAVFASTALFLAGLVVLQSAWMAVFVDFFCRFPGSLAAQAGILCLLNGAVTATCLALSSVLRSTAQASLVCIYFVGFQLPLSGAVLALPDSVRTISRPFIASYWGWSGMLQSMKEARVYDIVQQITQTDLALVPVCMWALVCHVAISLLVAYRGIRRAQPF